MPRRLAVVALAFGVTLAPSNAAARPDATTAAPPSLRQLAKGLVAVGSPGAVVYVRDAKGARAGTAGYANLRTKERMGAGHVFRVGSITKTFVATVVLQLATEGALGLDDPVERWLPGLVPNGAAITLRHLLGHTSGIYNYTDDARLTAAMVRSPLEPWTPVRMIQVATSHPPLFAPGRGWSYSNTGYIVLGMVVESATGHTLADELRARIIEPLGLARTSLPTTAALAAPFAHGYVPPGNGIIPTPGGRPADVTGWSASWAWAAGGIVSNVRDVSRFYAALLGGELLSPERLREMKTTVPAFASDRYGLGLQELDLGCGRVWGHSGSTPGYTVLAYNSEDGSHQAIVVVNVSIASGRLASRFGGALSSGFCR